MQGPYVARLDELFGEWADGAPGVRST
jgi:hypothetical protein